MSQAKHVTAEAPKHWGVMAEFETVDQILHAASEIRKAGFTRWDCHTPFPVHGLDDAMGVRPTRLPWLILLMGATGVGCAQLMQHWMNGVDYPMIISGKPLISWPSSIPVTFEMMVLFAAFTAFFAMWIANDLPRWFHPLLRKPRFARATNDRFFVSIEARDPQFDAQRTAEFLKRLHPASVELVEMPQESTSLPPVVKRGLVVLTCAALVPPAMIYNARHEPSSEPPINLVPDMDDQSKFRAQGETTLFADGRMSRPPVAGTVARGELREDAAYWTGMSGDRFVERVPAAVQVTPELVERGRERFAIYCAPCHDYTGKGEGIVHQRAVDLAAVGKAAWTKPANLHDERLRLQVTDGELFHVITNGKNTMRGYAAQIPARDRWAIVLYVRALQMSQQQ
jgi:mono/diheme cytochrome c family protein